MQQRIQTHLHHRQSSPLCWAEILEYINGGMEFIWIVRIIIKWVPKTSNFPYNSWDKGSRLILIATDQLPFFLFPFFSSPFVSSLLVLPAKQSSPTTRPTCTSPSSLHPSLSLEAVRTGGDENRHMQKWERETEEWGKLLTFFLFLMMEKRVHASLSRGFVGSFGWSDFTARGE